MRPVKIVIRKNKDTGVYMCGDARVLATDKWEHVFELGKWRRRHVSGAPCQAHLTAGIKICEMLNMNKRLSIYKLDVIGIITEQLDALKVYKDTVKKYLTNLKKTGAPGQIPSRYKNER